MNGTGHEASFPVDRIIEFPSFLRLSRDYQTAAHYDVGI